MNRIAIVAKFEPCVCLDYLDLYVPYREKITTSIHAVNLLNVYDTRIYVYLYIYINIYIVRVLRMYHTRNKKKKIYIYI